MFKSATEQERVTDDCDRIYNKLRDVKLNTSRHINFLVRGLGLLSASYVSLDAARPWIIYWCLAGLSILPGGDSHIRAKSVAVVTTLRSCQQATGGFGGGPGQLAHLATTYAAVLSLAMIGSLDSYEVIHRAKLYIWLMTLKHKNGGFRIHAGGEIDARAAYLALSVACLLDLLTPELTENTSEWLLLCQRYEGGMSGIHGAEAHAGLSYCALAALHILHKPSELSQLLDVETLLWWAVQRQQDHIGGYSGRTNKLVDGCYSWWLGAELPLIEVSLKMHSSVNDRSALKRYILFCCQPDRFGGLRDKPGKSPDYYHTCYCLAGLSAAERQYTFETDHQIDLHPGYHNFAWRSHSIERHREETLKEVHPIFVIPPQSAEAMRTWAVQALTVG